MTIEDLHPEELLRGRIVDRGDAVHDWDALESLAAEDPTLWLRLARDLRLDCEIRSAVGPRLRDAARVDAPPPSARAVVPPRRGTSWVGWAAAAVLGVLWWSDRAAGPEPMPELEIVDPRPAGVAPFSGDDPVAAGWDRSIGTAVEGAAALPGMLVRATPSPTGRGLRVVYVHRELREATVEEAFSIDGATSVTAAPLDRFETPTEF